MRQIAKVLVVAVFVSTVWTLPAHAVLDWFKCEVVLAGMPDTSKVVVRLTDLAAVPAFTSKNFVATSGNEKAILATALTAISTNLPVWIFADPDLAIPTFNQFYVANE